MYEPKAKTVEISATARNAVEIRGSWFTVEATEKRTVPTDVEVDLDKEWDALWDSVTAVVDSQLDDIYANFKTGNRSK